MSKDTPDLKIATLRQLQEAGLLKSYIPEDVIEDFPMMQEAHSHSSLWELIAEEYPEFLTDAGNAAESKRRDDLIPVVVLAGVEKCAPDEAPATQSQIYFLRSLGVKDELVLRALGKCQATAAIEQLLIMRDRNNFTQELTPYEKHPLHIAEFIFLTRKVDDESRYGILSIFGPGIPGIQGPLSRGPFTEFLATHLKDADTKKVHLAKDGQLVQGFEREIMISEAARLAANWI